MFALEKYISIMSVVLFCYCLNVQAKAIKDTAEDLKEAPKERLLQIYDKSDNSETKTDKDEKEKANARVKRDGSTNKYVQSTKTGQLKMLQLYLQSIRNLVQTDAIGGSHPLAVNSVKPLIALFKYKFLSIFFPDLGVAHDKD